MEDCFFFFLICLPLLENVANVATILVEKYLEQKSIIILYIVLFIDLLIDG